MCSLCRKEGIVFNVSKGRPSSFKSCCLQYICKISSPSEDTDKMLIKNWGNASTSTLTIKTIILITTMCIKANDKFDL